MRWQMGRLMYLVSCSHLQESEGLCSQRGIKICVVPGGVISYLQVGDIIMYKELKYNSSALIGAWNRLGAVEYTHNCTHIPPPVAIVCN